MAVRVEDPAAYSFCFGRGHGSGQFQSLYETQVPALLSQILLIGVAPDVRMCRRDRGHAFIAFLLQNISTIFHYKNVMVLFTK